MEMGVIVDPLAECLDGGEGARDMIFSRQCLELDRKGIDSAAIDLPKEFSPELEEEPQRLGNDSHYLEVMEIEKECLPYPLSLR
jgi:hypothetical protein